MVVFGRLSARTRLPRFEIMNVEAPVPPPLPRRIALVAALLLLSPICAEYLIGYDQIIGRPLELLGGLLILAPLYGTVAVLIREAVRRTGRGWPTIVLLSAAFGLVQAGLIDQSLFNPDFVDEPSWDRDRLPTHLPELGLSAKYLLVFVAGHVICAVLLGVAAFALPRRSDPVPGRVPPPWLVGCGAVVLWGVHQLAPASWTGVAVAALALTLAAGCLLLGVLLLLGLIDHRLRRSQETVAQAGRS